MHKILVVDDDEGILEAVALILESENYAVETEEKGERTYSKVSKYEPDLILLDVLTSGSDGREICKNLKSDPQTKDIPVIMMSAHPAVKKAALDLGADDFLAKPFEIDDLLRKIDRELN